MNDQGVFVLAEDGVEFFPTVAEAAAYVEAVDVENGVWEAFISLDGERLLPRPVDETSVRLERSGDHDKVHLIWLLEREHATRRTFSNERTRCRSRTSCWTVGGKPGGPSGPTGWTGDFMVRARLASSQRDPAPRPCRVAGWTSHSVVGPALVAVEECKDAGDEEHR